MNLRWLFVIGGWMLGAMVCAQMDRQRKASPEQVLADAVVIEGTFDRFAQSVGQSASAVTVFALSHTTSLFESSKATTSICPPDSTP